MVYLRVFQDEKKSLAHVKYLIDPVPSQKLFWAYRIRFLYFIYRKKYNEVGNMFDTKNK